jgi:hypothetical protein
LKRRQLLEKLHNFRALGLNLVQLWVDLAERRRIAAAALG